MAEKEAIRPDSIGEVSSLLAGADYIIDRPLATVVYLALTLEKPLFLEGRPGVGKTELALVLSRALGRELVRLQCYEGLDAAAALYEWNYPKQLLRIKTEEIGPTRGADLDGLIFSEDFLLDRPLLKAIRNPRPTVLLIDELDRADEEFEAFLLEILAEFQVTIPELGTITATNRPVVIITSNRTREINDALKRRCLYHWIDYPDYEKELDVLKARLPEVDSALAEAVVSFLQRLRTHELIKEPGLSETLDWARALVALNARVLGEDVVRDTLGCILKHHEDSMWFLDQIWSDEGRRELLLAKGTAC